MIGRRPGHVVPWRCPSCGAYAPAAARFCGNCGAALTRHQFADHSGEHIQAPEQNAGSAPSVGPTRTTKQHQGAGAPETPGSASARRPRELPWSDEDFACLTDKAKSDWSSHPYEPVHVNNSVHVGSSVHPDRSVESNDLVHSDTSERPDDLVPPKDSIHADRPLFSTGASDAATPGLRVERMDRPPHREGQRRWSFAVLVVVVPVAAAIGIAAGNVDWSSNWARPKLPAAGEFGGSGGEAQADERDRSASGPVSTLDESDAGQGDTAAAPQYGRDRSVRTSPLSPPRASGTSATNGQSGGSGSSPRTTALRDRPAGREPPPVPARPPQQVERTVNVPSAAPVDASRGGSAGAKPGPAELSEARACATAGSSKVSASGEFVVWIQWALSQLGYQPGPADGKVGAGTRAAICAFQSSTGMAATGEIDDRLVERLRMAVGRASMSR